MKAINWLALGLIITILFLIGLALGTGLLGYCSTGMMGPWGFYAYPGGMMGGWGRGLGSLLLIGLMGLIPLSLLALLMLGIVWLVRTISAPAAQPPVAIATCPDCHKAIQADWQNCPYCGRKLR